MYEPGRHYAKQNKPDIERQMLQNLTHLYIEPEKTKLIDAKNGRVVTRSWWGGRNEILVKVYQVPVSRCICSGALCAETSLSSAGLIFEIC